MQRVVVLEAELLELALHEAEIQVLRLVLLLRAAELTLEIGDLPCDLSGGRAHARVGKRLHRLLVRRVGVEPLLLGGDRVLQVLDLEAVELRLELLPRPAEDVVVGDAPERPDEEQQRRDEPDGAVGALLVVDRRRAAGHLPAHARCSSRRPTQKSAQPVTAM